MISFVHFAAYTLQAINQMSCTASIHARLVWHTNSLTHTPNQDKNAGAQIPIPQSVYYMHLLLLYGIMDIHCSTEYINIHWWLVTDKVINYTFAWIEFDVSVQLQRNAISTAIAENVALWTRSPTKTKTDPAKISLEKVRVRSRSLRLKFAANWFALSLFGSHSAHSIFILRRISFCKCKYSGIIWRESSHFFLIWFAGIKRDVVHRVQFYWRNRRTAMISRWKN